MRNIYTLIFCLLTMPALTFAADEKEKEPQRIADVWNVVPKDGHGEEFYNGLKAHMAFRSEKNDPRMWQVYTPTTGSELNKYIVRACCYEWSDQDSYIEWTKTAGTGKNWNELVHPHVESYSHDFIETDSKNSHWKEGTVANYVGVTNMKVKSGSGQKMNKAISAMSKVAKDHNWDKSWWWAYPVSGDTDVSLAIPFANFADMAPLEESFYKFVVRVLDSEDEANKLFDNYSSSIDSSSYTIYKHEKELSMTSDKE